MADAVIDEAVRTTILEGLERIESEQGVSVLYAAESGSRAWGFASPDSDYDVRFLYRHAPVWYTSILEQRDVIEVPIEEDLDISGWDLRKALRLFLKSNPPLHEWLTSPIVYRQGGGFREELLALSEAHYSPRTVAYHYRSIAARQWKTYMRGAGQVRIKKYFYCLRPLLAVNWLRDRGSLPPMLFQDLLKGVELPEAVEFEVDKLLEKKAVTSELGADNRISVLDTWIEDQLIETESFCKAARVREPALQAVNAFFRRQAGLDHLPEEALA